MKYYFFEKTDKLKTNREGGKKQKKKVFFWQKFEEIVFKKEPLTRTPLENAFEKVKHSLIPLITKYKLKIIKIY